MVQGVLFLFQAILALDDHQVGTCMLAGLQSAWFLVCNWLRLDLGRPEVRTSRFVLKQSSPFLTIRAIRIYVQELYRLGPPSMGTFVCIWVTLEFGTGSGCPILF